VVIYHQGGFGKISPIIISGMWQFLSVTLSLNKLGLGTNDGINISTSGFSLWTNELL